MRKNIFISLLFSLLILFSFPVFSAEPTVCCEKVNVDLYCQDIPSSQCPATSTQSPTSCDTTSYCKPGVCFNSIKGTCLDNTPKLVCNQDGGIWSEDSPPQCELGCCILGDQAAFVTQTRCKSLSANFGLTTNYDSSIKDEIQCILTVQNQDKGACVYDSIGIRTCKFTTRSECSSSEGKAQIKGEFFKDRLCSDESLKTNCGRTENTICVPGKDEVYFVDTCGNPANIYDSSKVGNNNLNYWSEVADISEVCKAKPNDPNCGNCNYLEGSFCRDWSKQLNPKRPTYGTNICADLNCKETSAGFKRHGESWCIYKDKGEKDKSNNAVGSRFYKHICVNGEEILEQCAEFRQEECIEDSIETTLGKFSQAACRVNRWQDCTAQSEKADCENLDRRDCSWKDGITLGANASIGGVCLPKNSPGLKFWESEEAKSICAQANDNCVVTYEKKIGGDWKCSDNCHCLKENWKKDRSLVCTALGDCGPKINWVGEEGYKPGFRVTTEKVKSK